MQRSNDTTTFSVQESMSFQKVIEDHSSGMRYTKRKSANTTVQQTKSLSKSSDLWGLRKKEHFEQTPVETCHESESDSEEEEIKPAGLLFKRSVSVVYSKCVIQK